MESANNREWTRHSLAGEALTKKECDRNRNILVLGILSSLFNLSKEKALLILKCRLGAGRVNEAHLVSCFEGGYNSVEDRSLDFDLVPKMSNDSTKFFRTVGGNEAIALGLIAASSVLQRPLYYSSYPITLPLKYSINWLL